MGKRAIQSIPLKYCKISYEKRVELIQSVLANGNSILQTAKMLGIKFSTAKLIIKRFRESGYIFETREDQQNRLEEIPEMGRSFNNNEVALKEASSPASINSNTQPQPNNVQQTYLLSLYPAYCYGAFPNCLPLFGTFIINS